MALPRQEDVSQFVAFTGVDEGTARDALQREPVVEVAINKFLDGTLYDESIPLASTWNESEMHAGKEYGPQNQIQSSFRIESEGHNQTLGPDLFKNQASRPPSRVDGEMNDVARGITAVGSQPTQRQDGNFRPATQAAYDDRNWAMTTTRTQSVLEDPEPKQRARMPGMPAFIKPGSDEHRLPGLLTIYQQIPLAREAFLAREHIQQEYGHVQDWWQGQSIPFNQITTITDDGQRNTSQTPVLDEMQRLMAFLELSERAYCNIDPLLDAVAHSSHRPWQRTNNTDADLIPVWKDELAQAVEDPSLKNAFTISAYERTDGEVTEQTHFQLLKLQIQYPIAINSLYDLIDEVLWGQWVKDAPTELFLEFGDIVTFEMGNDVRTAGNKTGPIEWPLVWYGDRYLEEHIDKALKMLYSQAEIEEERSDMQKQQDSFVYVGSALSGNRIPAVELLKIVKPFLNGERKDADELDHRDEDIASGAKYHPVDDYSKLGKQLQHVAEDIQRQHDKLHKAKDQLDIKKKDVTDYLKEPTAEMPLKARYTLRGVCVDAYTTFLLVNPNSPDDLLETNVNSWPWWRIFWDSSSESPIDVRKVDATDVSEAASKAENLTAVYANDKALKYPQKPLPDALKNFVRHDNLYFDTELQNPGTRMGFNRGADDDQWRHIQGNLYQNNNRSPNSSSNSMALNLDVDMQDMAPLIEEDDLEELPSYSATPPPIPPRIGEKRRAGARSPQEDLMDADFQVTGTISLLDDDAPIDIHIEDSDSFIQAPDRSNTRLGDARKESYPKEIQLTDVDEKLGAAEPSPKRATKSAQSPRKGG